MLRVSYNIFYRYTYMLACTEQFLKVGLGYVLYDSISKKAEKLLKNKIFKIGLDCKYFI